MRGPQAATVPNNRFHARPEVVAIFADYICKLCCTSFGKSEPSGGHGGAPRLVSVDFGDVER